MSISHLKIKLPVASGGVSKWIEFYILRRISKSQREAFCSFCSSFLGEAKRKIANCLRALARVFAISGSEHRNDPKMRTGEHGILKSCSTENLIEQPFTPPQADGVLKNHNKIFQ